MFKLHKRFILLLVVLLFYSPFLLMGQNIVNNPSFENGDPPTGHGQINKVVNWSIFPNQGTADYYRSDGSPGFNWQVLPGNSREDQMDPADGNAYVGIRINSDPSGLHPMTIIRSEYVGQLLTNSLDANSTYRIRFKWSYGNNEGALGTFNSGHAIKNLGVYFSDANPSHIGINVIPVSGSNINNIVLDNSTLNPLYNFTDLSNGGSRSSGAWATFDETFTPSGSNLQFISIGVFPIEPGGVMTTN